MNVGRGLFRLWIFVTTLWVVGIGVFVYGEIPSTIKQGKWQYTHFMRSNEHPNKVDWTKPYYENMKSPSAEHLEPEFSTLGYQYIADWDKSAREGRMIVVDMPDRSSLYLTVDLTKDDQEYISRAFWDQRWWRYAKTAQPWAIGLVVPPALLFVLGWALLWVARGFKRA
jgi:hypothetical protein